MSERTEPGLLSEEISLYDHAMRLHLLDPGAPLPRDGEPYPDDERHQRDGPRSGGTRRRGVKAADILQAHFARAEAQPTELT